MKILTIMGSERKTGNTAKFLKLFKDRLIKENDEIYEFVLKDLNYIGCTSCYGCAKVPYCIIKDDLTELYSLIETVDVVIFATPIYFNSVSGISKNFIDRMQVYWCRKFILKLSPIKEKIGIALINGGAPGHNEQFIGSELVFDHFFKSITCKRKIFVEISDTDKSPVDTNNEKFIELLDDIDFSFEKDKTYRLSGGKIII